MKRTIFRWQLLVVALVLLFTAESAFASHFRFGHHTWRRISNNPDGSVTVEFTALQAWRADFPDALGISFGDGTDFFPQESDYVLLATLQDIAAEGYIIRQYVVRHTYSAADIAARNGIFTTVSQSCCRIGSLQNAGDADERLIVDVDLNNGNTGSPKTSLPVILQLPVGKQLSLLLPAADPDGDPVSCIMATPSESQIPSVATFGAESLSVSPGCVLSWNLTGATTADVGKKYAAQVILQEGNRCNVIDEPIFSETEALVASRCTRTPVDFIIELVEGNIPECVLDKPSNSVAFVGVPFVANFVGTDADPQETLTVQALGVPTGASLTPANGTSGAAPLNVQLNWTPKEEDKGIANAITVTFRDSNGLENSCLLSIQVSDAVITCASTDQSSQLFALDGIATAQKKVIVDTVQSLRRRGLSAKLANSYTAKANSAYLQAWSAAWSLPQNVTTCDNSEVCPTSVFTSSSTGYSKAVSTLRSLGDTVSAKARELRAVNFAKRLTRANNRLFKSANSTLARTGIQTSSCE